ncbi:hypothetical protein [Bacillus thuringiensis]|nr:hypothetical protein [Bacillus thuringiensis]
MNIIEFVGKIDEGMKIKLTKVGNAVIIATFRVALGKKELNFCTDKYSL